jgi:penicillin-binding protein 1A
MVVMPRRARLLIALVLVALVAASCRYTTHLRLPDDQAVSSRILWDDGSLMTRVHGVEDRDPVTLDRMAKVLPRAVIAIEDERYYEHGGFDVRGILRALRHDVEQGRLAEGGSTITQQYVRAVMLRSHAKSFKRKLREAVMAMQLEDRYSKKTILERYLNTVYFGNGAYGVQAAARTYFARDAADVDLAQAAMLAGLIRAPNDYDPFVHPAEAVARRNEVATKMHDLHEISDAELALVIAAPVGVVAPVDNSRYPAPLFVEKVKSFITHDPHFGATTADRERTLFEGGLTIETTLDPKWQLEADTALRGVLTDPSDPPGAVVAIDPRDGHVKAYTSSVDFFDADPAYRFAAFRKLDLADARNSQGVPQRSPGSTFKPFVLATALEQGVPLSRRYDGPKERLIPIPHQPAWDLHNFGDSTAKDYGRINLIEATVNSVNTVYGQLVMDIGPANVAATARAMGIDNPAMTDDPSIAIGSQPATVEDMASAYGAFATDGVHHPEVFVTRVTDRDGRVLYEAHPLARQVLPPDVARTVTGVLQQVIQRGTGIDARIGRPAAGKTGSAENNTDAWFVGYTPELVAAVWVGEPQSTTIAMTPPLTRITVLGGTFPAKVWQVFASSALADVPSSTFPVPSPSSTTTTTRASTSPRSVAPGIYSVVGLNVIRAVQTLDQDGYRVVVVHAPSRRYPPNYVTAQDPPAGSAVRPGGTVTITVANGRPQVRTVPSVLGMPVADAAAAVRAAGFVANVVVEPQPPPIPADASGTVWKQAPISDTGADEGSTVTIWSNP